MQPEARLVKQILTYLRSRGGRWVKIHGGDNPFQEVGIPDILGCYRGWAVAIEAKVGSNTTSRKQHLFLEQWEEAGGHVCIARSVSDVRWLLSRIDDLEVS